MTARKNDEEVCEECAIMLFLYVEDHERKGSGRREARSPGQTSRAPTNLRLSKLGGRIARWYCDSCAYSSVSPTVVEQHEEKEHQTAGGDPVKT